MAINLFELQEGIVNALEADAGVGTAIGNRVYMMPPPNVSFPFARIDHVGSRPLEMVIGGAAKSQLTTEIVRIVVYTLTKDAEPASDAVEAIEAVMKAGAFTISGSSRAIQANFESRGMEFHPGGDGEASGVMSWTQWSVQMQDT